MIGAVQRSAYWALVVVTVFQAVTAIVGGIVMLTTSGMGMPSSMLSQGPFASFLWPALILSLVVGGTQTVSAVLLIARRESALVWCAVAGFGMVIWIYVETVIIAGSSWLQWLYFITGIGQLALVVALAGVAGWLPRAPLRGRRP
ncbi:hypothetical protein [Microbacterium sp.]|mgnify:CR=1 FL=1|uniref:hypothetical protein n=1 Tax=Microbacterium sp. TaxID=51671 RepID=UPI00092B7415|nr:hypothetical protein [Microbacterium sp.]MBN9191614.1 hypothetical protein [Microbacterium sp.]OJU69393.1 MAG: hypothetical protein BGO04_09130 [Microbacterium sp. 70-38]